MGTKKTFFIDKEVIFTFIIQYLICASFILAGSTKYLFVLGIAAIVCFMYVYRKIPALYWIIGLPVIVYCVIGIPLAIYQNTVSNQLYRQLFFYMIPIVLAIAMAVLHQGRMEEFVTTLFYATFAAYLTQVAYIYTVMHLNDTESSQYAFIFGAFVVYFLYRKKPVTLALAVFADFLSSKRIVWGATVIIVAVWLLYLLLVYLRVFRKHVVAKVLVVYAIFIGVLFFYFNFIYTSQLGPWMWDHNINPMGRSDAYDAVKFMYELRWDYVGLGMGHVADYLSRANISGFGLLHNDDLAMYIELGCVGYLAYLTSYGMVFRTVLLKLKQREAMLIVVLFIYTFVNYMTDNISIYISYLYPLYIMIFALMEKGEKA